MHVTKQTLRIPFLLTAALSASGQNIFAVCDFGYTRDFRPSRDVFPDAMNSSMRIFHHARSRASMELPHTNTTCTNTQLTGFFAHRHRR